MKPHASYGDAGLSVAGLMHVDEACDRFEQAWRDGERPALAAFLAEAPQRARRHLFRELLVLELEFLRAWDESPDHGAYRARFPEHQAVIDAAFGLPVEPPSTSHGDGLASASGRRATVGGERCSRAELHPMAVDALRAAGYLVVGELGRGGMGVVYLARKVALNRPCALKMILAGAHAGTAAAARFRAEAEAVARLRHPDIVQIFHVGEAEGLSYIELEYLAGGSLDKVLDGTPQPPVDAARLLEILARAIAEAHRQGIVHRDLKPANILLDVDGRPKVADFGLAKVLDSDDGLTRTNALIGSPSYMAPEQAEGQADRVGPLTDVYALGAILYELLAGRPPFHGATPLETLAQIKSAELVPPSRLQPGLPRDVETICLKCLQREPAQRYASALALAEDLRRYAEGEPIVARPISLWERTWRAAVRAPLVAGLLALVALLTVLGFALVSWQWRRAERARQTAQTSLVAVGKERDRAEAGLAEAERNYAIAREAVDRYFTRISEDRLLNEPHVAPLRKDLLQTAREFYQRFVDGRGRDPTAQSDLAETYNRLAEIDGALGVVRDRRADAEKAKAIFTKLVAQNPKADAFRRGLAQSETTLGACSIFEGRPADAEGPFARALALSEPLAANNPDSVDDRDLLAKCHFNQAVVTQLLGRLPAAEPGFIKAKEIWEGIGGEGPKADKRRSNLAYCYRSLGHYYLLGGRAADAESAGNRAQTILEALVKAHPEAVDQRRNLAATLTNLSALYQRTGRLPESEAAQRQSAALNERLVNEHPEVTEIRADLARNYLNLGINCRDNGKTTDAEDFYGRAIALQEKLVAEHPETPLFRQELGHTLNSLSIQFHDGGQLDKAEAATRRALALREALVAQNPQVNEYRGQLAFSLGNLGNINLDLGRAADAEQSFRRSLEIYEALAAAYPAIPEYPAMWGRIGGDYGTLQLCAGRTSEALTTLQRARAILERQVAEHLGITNYQADLGNVSIRLGAALERSGDRAAAAASCRQGLEILQAIAKPSARFLSYRGRAHALLGALQEAEGHSAGDRETHEAMALAIIRRAIAGGLRNPYQYQREPALKSLQSQPAFQALMFDLAFPRDPFGPARAR